MGRLYFYLLLLALIVGVAVGLPIGWHIRGTAPALEVVTAEPGQLQRDGSVVAPRVPAPAKPVKPPHVLPAGAREERRIAVTVQPEVPDCPPVTLDLSLVQVDGGRRVVASSLDGAVVSSLDMPIIPALLPPLPRPWAIGASYSLRGERYGTWIERDIGRVRIGADVSQDRLGDVEGIVRIGWTF